MRLVEINGVKLEVDERTARTVESYHVGDKVQVLVKSYGSQYEIHPGVIVGFSDFQELPSIQVMYVNTKSWETEPLKFVTLNAKTEGIEIAPMTDAQALLDRDDVIRRMDKAIREAEMKLEGLISQRWYFVERFSAAFADFKVREEEDGDEE